MTRAGGSSSRLDHLLAAALGVATLVALLATTSDLGFARDEGFYFHAARAYQRWFDVLAENPDRALRAGSAGGSDRGAEPEAGPAAGVRGPGEERRRSRPVREKGGTS